ncbi:hypothetical protein BHY08_01805 [Vagococcus teuberi]|uniref:Uncharacterized protein n=1 Tax=Vagococcus teuberi TaxID=519472 RepID=A0A1J0A417_9ENTE|nr:hypothetical protein [Vagococcus teuberi]APB30670.1 hypothetical protein BHY08_01805 [Vagococcus teuberi]
MTQQQVPVENERIREKMKKMVLHHFQSKLFGVVGTDLISNRKIFKGQKSHLDYPKIGLFFSSK